MTQDIENIESRNKTILVVDDSDNITKFCSYLLVRQGYRVITAPCGKAALEIVEAEKPELILTDMIMPGMTGLEMLARLKSNPQTANIPVIIETAYGTIDSVREAFKLGAVEYIQKPFDAEKLLLVVKQQFDSPSEAEIGRPKRLNRPLEAALQYLEKNNKKTEEGVEKYRVICGTAAHSLKNEFMRIGNALREIKNSEDVSEEVLTESETIQNAVEYSQLILRRLLDYLEFGGSRLEPVSGTYLLERIESLILPRLSSRIQFEIRIKDKEKPLQVLVDTEQVVGVLLELVQNAARAMHERGGKIFLTLDRQDKYVTLSVQDNGLGIPKTIQKVLFKQQVPSKKGLGLGLFLANKVIEGLGGKIKMAYSARDGTNFTIFLPVAAPQEMA